MIYTIDKNQNPNQWVYKANTILVIYKLGMGGEN